MSSPFVNRCKEYVERATKGPWSSSFFSVQSKEAHICNTYDGEYIENNNQEDPVFIARSRTDFPEALRRLELAERALEQANCRCNFNYFPRDLCYRCKALDELENP